MTKKARATPLSKLLNQPDPYEGQQQDKMKKLVVTFLLSATGFAVASEEPEIPQPVKYMEEVVVTGYDWGLLPEDRKGMLMMGIAGDFLIHEYDKKLNGWKFIRASKQAQKGKNE